MTSATLTLEQLAQLVESMRSAQRRYFRERTPAADAILQPGTPMLFDDANP